MERPLVSIIIPVYNRADLVGETIGSILAQTYDYWECILVDDHSNDNTLEILQQYGLKDSRISCYERPTDRKKGANACRNYGFEKSKGALINWFDSDDLMKPTKLQSQVEALMNSNFPFTVCQTEVFEGDSTNILGLRKENIVSNDIFNDFITNKIKWLTQAPIFRREFIEEHNLRFDEMLMKAQERDFFIKVLDKSTNYHVDNTPLVLFRKHAQSISYSTLTPEKSASTFRANARAIEEHRSRLSSEAIQYLKGLLKSEVKKSLQIKAYDQVDNFHEKLRELQILNPWEHIKLKLGIFTLKYFKTGEKLIN